MTGAATGSDIGLENHLVTWARQTIPGAAGVTGVYPMPGNAGLSFGFDVIAPSGRTLAQLVIRLAPPGVRRRGNTDILRQVPLLTALQDSRIPVAGLVWHSTSEEPFGTDAIIQRRLRELPLHLSEESGSVATTAEGTDPFLREAVNVLAKIHAVSWKNVLPGWEKPKGLADEITFWTGLLDKSPEAGWQALGGKVADVLRATLPSQPRIGLCHGDFQTNNILYRPDATVTAVVDWEIAGIGATLTDLGWLSIMTDPACWHPGRRSSMRVTCKPERLLGWYAQASASDVHHFDWYRAFACFKFGCIAVFNVRLHRMGRRVDPVYDELAPSITTLFERAGELARPVDA
jgi:aminoglycoside phosphotransferase (APT) family kinase protein